MNYSAGYLVGVTISGVLMILGGTLLACRLARVPLTEFGRRAAFAACLYVLAVVAGAFGRADEDRGAMDIVDILMAHADWLAYAPALLITLAVLRWQTSRAR